MARTQKANLPQETNNNIVTFVNADGTTKKDFFVPGANGGTLRGIQITSDDVAAVVMQFFYFKAAGAAELISSVNVPALSGSNGTIPPVGGFGGTEWPGAPVDANGNRVIEVKAGDKIQCAPLAAVTVAKRVVIAGIGDDL